MVDANVNFNDFHNSFSEQIAWVDNMLLNEPLYISKEFATDYAAAAAIYQIDEGEITFDCHCVDCGRSSVFRRAGSGRTFIEYISHDPMRAALGGQSNQIPKVVNRHALLMPVMICQRNNEHCLIFHISADHGKFQKIGQLPSLEDVAGADIERFRKLLGKTYFPELRRAGGLASHGIGIGAFVYLRRVFEKLIWDHYDEFKTNSGKIDGFETFRMDEKIAALAALLPKTLVANKGIYSILSKGIHELSEAECKAYFPTVRAGIIAILEQDLADFEKAETEKRLSAEIAKIVGNLKK
ncbi:hypothetical protein [Rhizobium sp. PL01]|uniref:hypothetical protein n=1 Tax=Rhizobium sp. PL01 TaxID=3085631 RepID=UPI002980A8AD|nr:hypothetical protein [Rhizobium sp. PL01]MDW5315367.1 hypothetical protein [Rhizobium sp. PL01]